MVLPVNRLEAILFDFGGVFLDSPFHAARDFGERVGVGGERLLPRLASLGDSIESNLRTLQQRHPKALRGVRRAGMMFGLDFADDVAGTTFLATMFGLGVLVVASSQRMDVIKLYPPLILEPQQVAVFSERMESALRQMG